MMKYFITKNFLRTFLPMSFQRKTWQTSHSETRYLLLATLFNIYFKSYFQDKDLALKSWILKVGIKTKAITL